MTPVRVLVVRTSLCLNAVLILYLCLSWKESQQPVSHSNELESFHLMSHSNEFESFHLIEDSGTMLEEAPPVLSPTIAPLPLVAPSQIDVSPFVRSIQEELLEEEPPREVQEGAGITDSPNLEPLPVEGPDPPLDSTEHKMYADLRDCATRPMHSYYYQKGDYWVLENYVPAALTFRCDESVTYTTHADYTFLDNLDPLTSRWQGPVSISVYAPGSDFEATLTTILYLRECWAEGIKKYVTFHLIFHNGHPPKQVPTTDDVLKRTVDCGVDPPKWVNVTTYREQKKLLYPVNVARNVARTASQTYFVFPSDIELYPSPGFIPEFFKMLKQPDVSNTTNPRVYVFPIFEVTETSNPPETKAELQTMLKNNNSIPFHYYVCPKCHNIPKAKEWAEAPVKPGMSVFHVGKRLPPHHKWEPIYVGTYREPPYDERLSWEGKSDKMTQMYILCVRDYEFHILDNAFLVHKPGIKIYKKEASREKFVTKQNKEIKAKMVPEYKSIFGQRKTCVI